MKKSLSLLVLAALLAAGCVSENGEVTTVAAYPTDCTNVNYPVAKAPLQSQSLVKLPVGSIAPGGWLRTILDAQKDGLNGHLGEISAWLQKGDNAWLTSGGQWGWEEVPYWLRGYSSLAYVLDDPKMLEEVRFWVDAIL